MSLERGLLLDRKRSDRQWRMSASPQLSQSTVVRSSRLERIAQWHHIPRVQSIQTLNSWTSGETYTPRKDNKMDNITDSGQETMTEDESSSGQSELSSFLLPKHSNIRWNKREHHQRWISRSQVSTVHNQTNNVIHRYIASRGQRERETDIYEVNPPPTLMLQSCDI